MRIKQRVICTSVWY